MDAVIDKLKSAYKLYSTPMNYDFVDFINYTVRVAVTVQGSKFVIAAPEL